MSVIAEQTGLTPKQQLFIDAYVSNGRNATQAAKTAGYSGDDKQLSVIGNQNLNKLSIRNALSYRSTRAIKKADKRIVNVYEEFTKNLEFVGKLRDASERWLQHPDNIDLFTIEPRADEIDCVYFDYEDKDAQGNPKRKVECLQELLARLQGTRYESDTQFVKTTDIREFALKSIDRIDTTLDKFAKMGGEYTKDKDNPDDLIKQVTSVAQQLYNDHMEHCKATGQQMPSQDEMAAQIKQQLCDPNGVSVERVMALVVINE